MMVNKIVFCLSQPVGRWYAEGLRDMEESVPMRDKMHETLPLFRWYIILNFLLGLDNSFVAFHLQVLSEYRYIIVVATSFFLSLSLSLSKTLLYIVLSSSTTTVLFTRPFFSPKTDRLSYTSLTRARFEELYQDLFCSTLERWKRHVSVAEVQFSPVLPPFFEDREPNWQNFFRTEQNRNRTG